MKIKDDEIISKVIDMLKQEPRTANELAHKLKIHHHTAKRLLLELALKNKSITSKKVGRYKIWWWRNEQV
mgnify:CR=1 FL=1